LYIWLQYYCWLNLVGNLRFATLDHFCELMLFFPSCHIESPWKDLRFDIPVDVSDRWMHFAKLAMMICSAWDFFWGYLAGPSRYSGQRNNEGVVGQTIYNCGFMSDCTIMGAASPGASVAPVVSLCHKYLAALNAETREWLENTDEFMCKQRYITWFDE
jgi:hypothetical protein